MTGFKTNTLSRDLAHIVKETKAKSCFIPRQRSSYRPLNYAFLSYANEEDYIAVSKNYYELDGRKLIWGDEKMKTCHACGSPDHIVVNCTEIKRDTKPRIDPKLQRLYARYRPAQHKKLPKSYADAARRPTYNPNRNQYNGNRQVSNSSQKELADLRSILTDLSRQITNLATEYKSMKMSGNTAQAGASSSASTTLPNTLPKNVSKNQPPNKKHKTQQQTPEKRPWNKANLLSENNSSSEQPSSDPFMNKYIRKFFSAKTCVNLRFYKFSKYYGNKLS